MEGGRSGLLSPTARARVARLLAGRALAQAGEQDAAAAELERTRAAFDAFGSVRQRAVAERELRKLMQAHPPPHEGRRDRRSRRRLAHGTRARARPARRRGLTRSGSRNSPVTLSIPCGLAP